MTDLELIQALRYCRSGICPECKWRANCRSGEVSDENAADRLEVAIDNQKKIFAAGAMAMQEAVLDILNRVSVKSKGAVRSTIRDAMAVINNLEVEHE